ncbi:MAG: KOW domain-containing RNA-binding protein [Clostridia bacterium]
MREDYTLNIGDIVISFRGHDKGKLLVVLSVNNDKVYVADGDTRKIDKKKFKNVKHIRYKGKVSEQLTTMIVNGNIENCDIKKALKAFLMTQQQ